MTWSGTVSGSAEVIVDNALGGWGSPPNVFPLEIRAAYIAALYGQRWRIEEAVAQTVLHGFQARA